MRRRDPRDAGGRHGGVSHVLGRLLALAIRVLARRAAAKPMHPLGRVYVGRLVRPGPPHGRPPTGAAWLDLPGSDEVLVRLSRSVGLPTPWPDVNGLAIRAPRADGGYGDLLMNSTGWARATRYLLLPRCGSWTGSFTTLVPYRTPTGAVHVGARSPAPGRFELFWARPRGGWHRFAELECDPHPDRDLAVSYDAVLHLLDGLANYGWWTRLRGPAYDAARRSRGL